MNFIFDIVLKPSFAPNGNQCVGPLAKRCHVEVFEGLQQQREINWDKTTCARKHAAVDGDTQGSPVLVLGHKRNKFKKWK